MRYREPTGRQPYGRRAGSYGFVEDACPTTPDYWRWRPDRADLVRAIRMPHGGYRYLYRCRLCKAWRAQLYNLYRAPGILVCRRCMNLRYRSQYEGRRLEASETRITEALRELEQVKPPRQVETRERRERRVKKAARVHTLKVIDLEIRREAYLAASYQRAARHFERLTRRWVA